LPDCVACAGARALKPPVAVVALVPPDAIANVADRPAAVPVVFWLSVGNVQLVSVPEAGVPNTGVVSDGEVERTTLPEPVAEVTPVPPLDAAKVPVIWVVRPILPHAGAVATPPESKALPVATSDSEAKVDAVLA
jgi:hypothetical protein